MKVHERNESIDFGYPDEMTEILDYLNKHSKFLVKPSTDEQYSAGRMIVDEELLKEFEERLTGVDI